FFGYSQNQPTIQSDYTTQQKPVADAGVALEYRVMATPTKATTDGRSPIKFGTSGWRGLIADEFTFANVRLAVTAIAEHVKSKTNYPKNLVGYDTWFYFEIISQ